jgi:hypothetical protein
MMKIFLVGVMLAVLFYGYALCSYFLVQEVRDRKIQSKLRRKTLFVLSVIPVVNFLVFIGFALEFSYKIAKESLIDVVHEVEED